MKRESLVFVLGIVVALMPFLGIPNAWKRTGAVAAGLAIALVGYQLRRLAYLRSIVLPDGERRTDVYAERIEPQEEAVLSSALKARRSAKRV